MRRHSELAQGVVEAAVMVPICIFAIFAIMQVGWIAMCSAQLDSGIAHMQQDELVTSDAAAASKILEATSSLSPERLSVSGYALSNDDRSSMSRAIPRTGTDNSGSGYDASRNDVARYRVTCDVSYDAGLLFPIPGIEKVTTVKRTVDFTKVESRHFEVR